MVRLIIAFLCAAAACMLVAGALTSAQSPATSFPDAFVSQITNSNRSSGTNPVGSFVGDTSANGRFVVIESNGDIATEKTATRNNQDGNREIFLYDYAQRRIFQITNTRSVPNPNASPSPSPSVSPSPSPSPSASPVGSPSPIPTASPTPPVDEPAATLIEISNNRPMISLEPALVGGNRTYTIVFSSNAPAPGSFDGTTASSSDISALSADGNEEIWTYQFTVADTANLPSGTDVPLTDLSAGSFTRITNTPASRTPSPGSSGVTPFIADDNRDAQISDDGRIIAFVSTRNFAGTPGNPDFNPEVYLYNVATKALVQVTNTTDVINIPNKIYNPVHNENPCLSSDGSVLAFVSNANLTSNNDDGGGAGNDEIYIANFNGSSVSNLRQATKTKDGLPAPSPNVSPSPNASPAPTASPIAIATANLFTFGRRLSRDGKFIAFESLATDPKANAAGTSNTSPYVSFVYNVTADTFAQLGPRGDLTQTDPVLHLPVFTDYNGALSPASVMFTSSLDFTPSGTLVTDTSGMNPNFAAQIFLAPLPVISTGPFTRISNYPSVAGGVGASASNSHRRFAFSRPAELGGGNSDSSTEAFYELSPDITSDTGATLSLFTGASLIPVPVASPTATPSPTVSPTPTPSPSPSPSPSPTASPSVSPAASPSGLAAGELSVAQASVSLAPSSVTVSNANASESKRAPALPIELNGVSVSVAGAACGLYAVSPSQIKFVVPVGLPPGTYTVAINNNGTVIRGVLTIVPAQPDIFTSINGPGGRAVVCNATNPAVCTPEPFTVTTNDGSGTQQATILHVTLTGVRNTTGSGILVTIGTTSINAWFNTNLDLPGTDNIYLTLPSTVDTGDVPIVVTVGSASSRDTSTAPHVTINSGGSPLPNPIDSTSFFVRQQYLDFLSREPDADGWAFWQNQINACGSDGQCVAVNRINVSAAFFLSIEFQQTGYLVYRTYKAAYGNMNNAPVPLARPEFLPDTRAIGNGVIVNQTGWEQQLESNKVAFFADFVRRSRFTSQYPSSMTGQQFVDKLYANAGIAPASAPNRGAAMNEVNATPADNAARARALRLVADDPMLAQQEFNRAFVLMEYFGYLQRNPNDPPDSDYAGYNFWLNKLNQFNGNYINAEMVKAFLSSTEYRQRFGQ